MKTVKILLATLILTCFVGINQTDAKATVIKDITATFIIGGELVTSIDGHATISTSGNLTYHLTFQLAPDNPLVPTKGVTKTLLYSIFEVKVTKNGVAKVTYKWNPSLL